MDADTATTKSEEMSTNGHGNIIRADADAAATVEFRVNAVVDFVGNMSSLRRYGWCAAAAAFLGEGEDALLLIIICLRGACNRAGRR